VIAAALITGNFIGGRYGFWDVALECRSGVSLSLRGAVALGHSRVPMVCLFVFRVGGYSKVRRLRCGKSEVPGPKKIVLDTHRAGSATSDGLCAFG